MAEITRNISVEFHPMLKIKAQEVTDHYALYNGDCCRVMKELPTESIGMSVFSPPFADLYSYSDDIVDLSNSGNYDKFFEHFHYVAKELFRLSLPGRITAVHCMDLPTYKRNGEEIGIRDFPGDIVRMFQKYGFIYHSRHCIWKDPLVAATRTKAIGLAHKQIVKDSALCRVGIPDYILAFRKPGENPKPIIHPRGLRVFYGSRKIPENLDLWYKKMGWDQEPPKGVIEKNPYDPGKDKRSHWIWQQYASPVWFDIRQTRTLQYKRAREEEDERHICCLQLDTIERCIELWSIRGDIIFSPFAGVGSEIYVALKNGRKAVGVELKGRYFRQMVRNIQSLNLGERATLNGKG